MDEVEDRAWDLCKQYREKFGVQIGYEEGWQISMEEFCQKLQDCIDTPFRDKKRNKNVIKK